MERHEIIKKALELGALYARPVSVPAIRFYPSLRELCSMNSCGCYGTNWGCPPGCGDVADLSRQVASYQNGVVYQLVGMLEDSFDFEGMMACGEAFFRLSLALRDCFAPAPVWVLGAGKCTLCETCTYPDDACRFPARKNISVEACGINVSELCAAAGLDYIHGPNTVTNTGLILY